MLSRKQTTRIVFRQFAMRLQALNNRHAIYFDLASKKFLKFSTAINKHRYFKLCFICFIQQLYTILFSCFSYPNNHNAIAVYAESTQDKLLSASVAATQIYCVYAVLNAV